MNSSQKAKEIDEIKVLIDKVSDLQHELRRLKARRDARETSDKEKSQVNEKIACCEKALKEAIDQLNSGAREKITAFWEQKKALPVHNSNGVSKVDDELLHADEIEINLNCVR